MRLIVYIGFAQPDEWGNWVGTYARHAQRFEKASKGALCLVVPYDRVDEELMQRLAPDAVVMSGFARSFQDYEVKSFLGVTDWVKTTKTPTLALCGSHQLLGFCFHQDLRKTERLFDAPMRSLKPGEPITNPDYHPEFYMERGFYTLQMTEAGKADPIFGNMGGSPIVYESHYCEIKLLPPGFELLASTPECKIQAMRHRTLPIYSTQFHPEDYNERFSDGRKLLENFFQFAGK